MTKNHLLAIGAAAIALLGSGLAVLDIHNPYLGLFLLALAVVGGVFVFYKWNHLGKVEIVLNETAHVGDEYDKSYYTAVLDFSHAGDIAHALRNAKLEHEDFTNCPHFSLAHLQIRGDRAWVATSDRKSSGLDETFLPQDLLNLPAEVRSLRKVIWITSSTEGVADCQNIVVAVDDSDGKTWRSGPFLPGSKVLHTDLKDIDFGKA